MGKQAPPVRYRDKPEPTPVRGLDWMPIRGPDCAPFDKEYPASTQRKRAHSRPKQREVYEIAIARAEPKLAPYLAPSTRALYARPFIFRAPEISRSLLRASAAYMRLLMIEARQRDMVSALATELMKRRQMSGRSVAAFTHELQAGGL